MKFIHEALKSSFEYKEISEAFKKGKTPAVLTGVTAVHKNAVLYSLLRETNKSALMLVSEDSEALKAFEDFSSMGLKSAIYPTRDFSLRDTAGVSHEYERQRLDILTNRRGYKQR